MSERAKETNNIALDDRLEKFKNDLRKDALAVEEQRETANEDMRFVNVIGGQWEDFFEDFFNADRVKLELDLVNDPLQGFIGEWNQNRVGVEFKPEGSTSTEDSELLNGIYRANFRDHDGKLSTDNAVASAATCGVGAFKLGSAFEDEGDPENDNMIIEWRPIYNAYNTVFWDRGSQMVNKKDARWCTILKEFTTDEFLELYPDATPSSAFQPTLLTFDASTEIKFIYVATRYQVIRKKELVFIYNNMQSGEVEVYSEKEHKDKEAELKADEFREFVRERRILRQHVEKIVFSGNDILEKTRRIAGKWIPVISVYAFHSYVDGAERYRGIVRKLKDPQRLYNMQVSQVAENAASGGQRVPVLAPEQIDGHENNWANRNNKPYLLLNPLEDKDGNTIVPGPLGYAEPPTLDQNSAALLEIAPTYIQGVSGGVPQDTLDPNASGKAINAMIKRENRKTQPINDNIANSIAWSGTVYQSMAEEIYNSERIVKIIGNDGSEGEARLLETTLDKNDGREIQTNVLKNKKFRAYADVGPQYETLREQAVEDMKGMLEALRDLPGAQQYIGALIGGILDGMDGVGLEPIKELNRKIMITQGLRKPETDEEKAMVQQLQDQAQQPDAQQQLIEAASQQQLAEARNLDTASIQKIADARKKEAETVEILSGIQQENQKIDITRRQNLAKEQAEVIKLAQTGLG